MELDNECEQWQECECKQWARTGQKFWTLHHSSCPKYDPEGDACLVIGKLLQVMRDWGSEEDGIPDFACDAYDIAAISVGQNTLPKDSSYVESPPYNIKTIKEPCACKNEQFEEFDIFELPDPNALEILADWLDLQYPNDRNPEIQCDLRLWASNLRKINAKILKFKTSKCCA